MTEAEWNSCTDPQPMLEFLRGKESDRKWRLFVCGCCRRVWSFLSDIRSREAVEASERFADGLAGRRDLEAAASRAGNAPWSRSSRFAARSARLRLDGTIVAAVNGVGPSVVVSVLRDLFRPFRPASLDSAWLAWNDGAVRKMAHTFYDDRAFDRLPLLADALEDAGCTYTDMLGHCRSGVEHVRGCWVVDLLTGRA